MVAKLLDLGTYVLLKEDDSSIAKRRLKEGKFCFNIKKKMIIIKVIVPVNNKIHEEENVEQEQIESEGNDEIISERSVRN